MYVSKYLQPQILLINAIALPTLSSLITLALFIDIECFPAQAIPNQETITLRRFADWCLNKASLSPQTKYTVDVLLHRADTQDCNQADNKLSSLSKLHLSSLQIADLKPLSSLTKLTELHLYNNQIANLKPLSSLPNLTRLKLSFNQITDVKPLSSLTNLTVLDLGQNKIADITPLSCLTKLTFLALNGNQMLTNKTCPVKPKSIRKF